MKDLTSFHSDSVRFLFRNLSLIFFAAYPSLAILFKFTCPIQKWSFQCRESQAWSSLRAENRLNAEPGQTFPMQPQHQEQEGDGGQGLHDWKVFGSSHQVCGLVCVNIWGTMQWWWRGQGTRSLALGVAGNCLDYTGKPNQRSVVGPISICRNGI